MAEITNETCVKVLSSLAKNAKLIDFELKPFRNQLQGLIGEHLTLTINYSDESGTKTTNFFVKTLNTKPAFLSILKELLIYEKEALFYHLLKEYEKFGIKIDFAPRSYHFQPFTIIIEDLKQFCGTPKRELLNIKQCESGLVAIAQFHAASMRYESIKKAEDSTWSWMKEYKTELSDLLSMSSKAQAYFSTAFRSICLLIDRFLPNKGDELKAKLNELFENGESPPGLVNTIIHNDLWTSNLLHHAEDSAITKLIDFQTISYGPIELDLAKFFMTSTSRQFRQLHYNIFISIYYDELKKASDGLFNIEIGDFVDSCLRFNIAGRIHAIVDHSVTFLDDWMLKEAFKDESSFKQFFSEDRTTITLFAYENNVQFRNMLKEDIEDLYEALCN